VFVAARRDGESVPIPDSCSAAKFPALFYDLIGKSKQRGRNCEAEFLGGSEVDHELELGRRQHGKVTVT